MRRLFHAAVFARRPVLLGVLLLLVAGAGAVGCSGSGSNGSSGGPGSASGGPSFDSGEIEQGETFSYTFQDEGTEYYCTIHGSDMQGEIMVESGADSSGTARVSMEDTAFHPSTLSVQPGTEVVWTNHDSFAHTVTSGNPSSGENGGY